jgi:hypothetical protein
MNAYSLINKSTINTWDSNYWDNSNLSIYKIDGGFKIFDIYYIIHIFATLFPQFANLLALLVASSSLLNEIFSSFLIMLDSAKIPIFEYDLNPASEPHDMPIPDVPTLRN